mmetsp:Transcript_39881/g.83399  ORF Transcript_39881/g.83399 Transcript_39881/m.83399 type:complete len:91 (-) Transcript_39881:6-278(-)
MQTEGSSLLPLLLWHWSINQGRMLEKINIWYDNFCGTGTDVAPFSSIAVDTLLGVSLGRINVLHYYLCAQLLAAQSFPLKNSKDEIFLCV